MGKLKNQFYLPLLLLIYSLIRIPYLLSIPDSVYTFEPLDTTILSGVAESGRAGMAHFFLHGSGLPFWELTADPYGLGSLVVAWATVPFYKIFGETLFAFQLAPFFWQLLTVVAWFWVWSSFYSRQKSFFISLFFVLPTPRILEFSMTSIGSHFELPLLTALSLLLLKKILDGDVQGWVGGLLLGLWHGLSVSFVFSSLAIVAVTILCLTWGRCIAQRKKFYGTYLCGFFLGLVPWLWVSWNWLGINLDFFLYSLTFFKNFNPSYFLEGAGILIRWVFLRFFGFGKISAPAYPVLSFFLAAIYLFSLMYLGWRVFKNRKIRKGWDLERLGFLYQVFWLVWMVYIRERMEVRYLFSLVPFIGMTWVFALESFLPRIQKPLIVTVASLFLLSHVSLIHWETMGKSVSTSARPHYFGTILGTLWDRYWQDEKLLRQKTFLLLGEQSQKP